MPIYVYIDINMRYSQIGPSRLSRVLARSGGWSEITHAGPFWPVLARKCQNDPTWTGLGQHGPTPGQLGWGCPAFQKVSVLLRQNNGLGKKEQFGVDGMAVFYVCFAYTGRYFLQGRPVWASTVHHRPAWASTASMGRRGPAQASMGQ